MFWNKALGSPINGTVYITLPAMFFASDGRMSELLFASPFVSRVWSELLTDTIRWVKLFAGFFSDTKVIMSPGFTSEKSIDFTVISEP